MNIAKIRSPPVLTSFTNSQNDFNLTPKAYMERNIIAIIIEAPSMDSLFLFLLQNCSQFLFKTLCSYVKTTKQIRKNKTKQLPMKQFRGVKYGQRASLSFMLIRKRIKKTLKLTKVMIYVIIIAILNCFSFYFNLAGSNIVYDALFMNNSHLNTSNVNAIRRNMGDTCTTVTNTLMTCNPLASSSIKHTIIMRDTAV